MKMQRKSGSSHEMSSAMHQGVGEGYSNRKFVAQCHTNSLDDRFCHHFRSHSWIPRLSSSLMESFCSSLDYVLLSYLCFQPWLKARRSELHLLFGQRLRKDNITLINLLSAAKKPPKSQQSARCES